MATTTTSNPTSNPTPNNPTPNNAQLAALQQALLAAIAAGATPAQIGAALPPTVAAALTPPAANGHSSHTGYKLGQAIAQNGGPHVYYAHATKTQQWQQLATKTLASAGIAASQASFWCGNYGPRIIMGYLAQQAAMGYTLQPTPATPTTK